MGCPKVQYVFWAWQQCNLFVKRSAGTSVFYINFPGIYSADCCITRRIVVNNKMAVGQLRWKSGGFRAVRIVQIQLVFQGEMLRVRPVTY